MRSVFALFAAPIVVLVACSSNPPPPSTAPAGSSSAAATPAKADIPREAFAEQLAKVVCDATAPCCKGSYDEGLCRSEFLTKLEWKERVAKAKQFSGPHAAKCLEEAKGLATRCEAAATELLRLPSCAALLMGPGKTGDPCEDSIDCAPVAGKGAPFCWTGAMADEPGRCAVSAPPEKGAACFSPQAKTTDKKQLVFSECHDDPGMFCDPKTNKCIARPKSGGACTDNNECEDGSICSGAAKCKSLLGASCKRSMDCASKQACIAGKCAPGLKLGDKCSDFADCAEGICLGGSKVCGPWAAAFLCAK